MGKCHICRDDREIKYCPFCKHWMCDVCRWALGQRAKEAAKEVFLGPQPNCCGPKE